MVSQHTLIYILYTSDVPDAVNHFLVFVLEKTKTYIGQEEELILITH
jgi:hypothetical protein